MFLYVTIQSRHIRGVMFALPLILYALSISHKETGPSCAAPAEFRPPCCSAASSARALRRILRWKQGCSRSMILPFLCFPGPYSCAAAAAAASIGHAPMTPRLHRDSPSEVLQSASLCGCPQLFSSAQRRCRWSSHAASCANRSA
jgi:hypothetical protein